jgi:hypothetical protein
MNCSKYYHETAIGLKGRQVDDSTRVEGGQSFCCGVKTLIETLFNLKRGAWVLSAGCDCELHPPASIVTCGINKNAFSRQHHAHKCGYVWKKREELFPFHPGHAVHANEAECRDCGPQNGRRLQHPLPPTLLRARNHVPPRGSPTAAHHERSASHFGANREARSEWCECADRPC